MNPIDSNSPRPEAVEDPQKAIGEALQVIADSTKNIHRASMQSPRAPELTFELVAPTIRSVTTATNAVEKYCGGSQTTLSPADAEMFHRVEKLIVGCEAALGRAGERAQRAAYEAEAVTAEMKVDYARLATGFGLLKTVIKEFETLHDNVRANS